MPQMTGNANGSASPTVSLDVFTELSTMALTDADPKLALDKVVAAASNSVPGAVDVSITMLLDGRATTPAFADRLAYDLDLSQYGHNAGPCLDAGRSGEVQRVEDMRSETRWPGFAAEAADRGVLSSLSVPLPAQGAVTGALNIYGKAVGAFDDDAVAIASALASYAAVALFNVRVFSSAVREAESIKRAMDTRAVIEQSKGILMCRHACTAEQAWERLVAESQARNVKLRTVAEELVASVFSGT